GARHGHHPAHRGGPRRADRRRRRRRVRGREHHHDAARTPMMQGLKIAVADDERDVRDYYQRGPPRPGHRVGGVGRTGPGAAAVLLELCRADRPDLIITDIKMPDMDGIEAVDALSRESPIPVILVSAYHRPPLFERAGGEHILAYLVKPTKQADLEAAIAIAT